MPEDLTPERLSVDEFLEVQSNQPFKVTMEAVDGDSEAVKLTPWLPIGGCFCDMSLTVPKSSIEFVTMTDEVHVCCGKSLRVIEVVFFEDATISVKNLFDQLSLAASTAAQRMQQARGFAEHVARRSMTRNPVVPGEPNLPFHT